jgi:thiamine-monophosphate kinase
MGESRTELSELGEFGLIDHINQSVKKENQDTLVGIGDDAAVIDCQNENLLLTTDMLVEGIHFDLSYFPLHHLGYKAVACNVSDIAAMNGIPKQMLVSIALSNRFSIEAVDAIYAGINSACEKYKVDLVGGDTTSSSSGLIISVSILGRCSKEKTVLRSGASNKDIICVTGDLGGAYVGLQVLEREKEEFLVNPAMEPRLEKYNYIVGRQLKPEARMDIIHELSDLNVKPTSMIDISDGLASELFHLWRASGLGARIFEGQLPIDKMTYDTAVEFNLDPITCALNGGEDYELLFTIRQEDHEKLKNHRDIHFIGYMESAIDTPTLVTKGENEVPLKAQGWNHFTKR